MAHTRQLTGTIHKPNGEPWPDFAVGFDVAKTATVPHAPLPGTVIGAQATANTVTATTDSTGAFAAELEVEVPIRVTLIGALITSGTSTRYPPGALFDIVIPDGDTPIDMATVVAAGTVTPPGADWANLLAAHAGDTGNPHGVTAAQIGAATLTIDADAPASPATGDLWYQP